MNPSDDELDSLLETWIVPRSPDSLKERLRSVYADRARSVGTAPKLTEVSPVLGGAGRPRRWNSDGWARSIAGILPIASKCAGVIAGGVILLAVITRAFPQSLSFVAPSAAIMLDTEFLEYKDDGSYTVREYRTSSKWTSPFPGGETVLSSSFPGDPLRTAVWDVLNPMRAVLESVAHRMFDPLFYKPHRAEYLRAAAITVADRIRNRCTPTNVSGRPMKVIGQETVLNYTTTVSELSPEGWSVRFTEWFAPGLDCISLRSTTEKAWDDGTFRLVSERRVLKVTRNSGTIAAPERNQ